MNVEDKAATQTQKAPDKANTEEVALNSIEIIEGSCKTKVLKDVEYSVKVKPEYVLKERPSCLPELPPCTENTELPKTENHSKRSRKKKGMNKKRPRDKKIMDCDKACLSLLSGESCNFANCKYSHDMKCILASRPIDITQVEDGCPEWNLRGYCRFGVMCRLGKCHVNLSDGTNLRRDVPVESIPEEVKNVSRKDVMTQLRRNTYPFVRKKNKDMKREEQQAGKEILVDLTPLPIKRKLVDFSNKVYVAPLTTVGNLPFRRIMKFFGADITCGEMAIAQNLIQGQTSEWALLKRHPSEDIFGIQIASGYEDLLTRTAEVLEKEVEVDFIDMNLGCPIDLVCQKYGAGAALMLRQNKLKLCLEGLNQTLSCPFTVKIRTGWNETKPIALNLVRNIQEWRIDGLAAVMIHGRSRLQRYSKLANWEYIHEVASSQSPSIPKIPIIGNGDIFSYTDYEQKKSLSPNILPTAMLARGALIKPWLPTEIKERRHWDISATERLDMLKKFVCFGLEHWGTDQKGVNSTRRFLLEWLSFLYRYVPVGLLEYVPQQMNERPPQHISGRNDLETLMLSGHCADWIKISEMLLGPVPDEFRFEPKHRANGY